MPARRTPDEPIDPITEPGCHGGIYYCGCIALCSGIFQAMPRSTYNYHKKYRRTEQEAVVNATYEFIMGVSSPQQAQGVARGEAEGDEDVGAGMEWQQALFDDLNAQHSDAPGSNEHDNINQDAVDGQNQDHEWHDDPDYETREQDRRELADMYHPYLQGVEMGANPDSDDETDSDNEDDGPPPVANLQELKIALAYVQYVKAAQADFRDSGLAEDSINRLLNPPQCILELTNDPDLELSIGLFVDLGGTSQKSYDKAMKRLQRHADKDAQARLFELGEEDDLTKDSTRRFYTYEQVKKKIKGLTGVLEIKHDMCPKSCMAYTGPLAKLDRCLKCRSSRYHIVNGKKVPRQQFYTIPVGPQLQAMARSLEVSRLMQFRVEQTRKVIATETTLLPDGSRKIDVPVFEDYVHGRDYLQAVLNGDIRDGDFVLMLSIDGAQLYESKQSDCWIYIWVLMDLPPDQRFKKKYVMPGGFIPGPNKPKNLDSFLYPGLQHLSALQKGQFKVWNASQNRTHVSRPFLLHQTADGPGLCFCDGRTGHQGYIGCRLWCPIPGRRYARKSDTYYPALFRPNDWMPPGSDHADISVHTLMDTTSNTRVQDYEEKLIQVLSSRDMDEYLQTRRDTGISKPSIFSGLSKRSRLSMLGLFPSDMMHLGGLLLPDLMMGLFRGTIEAGPGDDKSTWAWAVLMDEGVWQEHGALVASYKTYLSSSIERPPRDPAKKINSGYKAKEFLSYVYGMLPALLYDVLPEPFYSNFCDLVWGIRIMTQRRITRDELQSAHTALVNFVVDFEKIYVERMGSRVHFVRQSLHNLIHLGPETIRTAPLPDSFFHNVLVILCRGFSITPVSLCGPI